MTSWKGFSVPQRPEAIPAVCPVSGLPIRSQPEWSYTHPDNTYRTTIALIGEDDKVGANPLDVGGHGWRPAVGGLHKIHFEVVICKD